MFVGTYTKAPSKGIYAYRFQACDRRGHAPGHRRPRRRDRESVVSRRPSEPAVSLRGERGQRARRQRQRVLHRPRDRHVDAAEPRLVTRRQSMPCLGRSVRQVGLRRELRRRQRRRVPGAGRWEAGRGVGVLSARRLEREQGAAERSARACRRSSRRTTGSCWPPISGWTRCSDLPDRPRRLGSCRAIRPSRRSRPGSGPRHLAIRSDGKFAYVLNEMLSSVGAYSYDAGRGTLAELQTVSTLPEGFSADNSGAEIVTHPTREVPVHVESRPRQHRDFPHRRGKGTLTPAGHVSTQGKTPRGFGIDPSGRFLVAGNQNSGTVVIFRIDQQTGGLTPTGTTLQVGSPVNVVFSSVVGSLNGKGLMNRKLSFLVGVFACAYVALSAQTAAARRAEGPLDGRDHAVRLPERPEGAALSRRGRAQGHVQRDLSGRVAARGLRRDRAWPTCSST